MLKDKVALITGAASGIGYAIAKKMTEEGCKVVIADVNKEGVEKVCKAVPGTVDAVVDLAAKTVTVTGTADVAALKQAITDADYTVVE